MNLPLTARYQRTIPVGNISTARFLAIANAVIERLGWEKGPSPARTVIAYTKVSTSALTREQVTVQFDGANMHILSRSISARMLGGGKNKGNVQGFIETFWELEKTWPEDDPALAAEEPQEGEEMAAMTPEGKDLGILSFFIPSKEFFITPLLVDINILVFIAMVISGANILQPDTEILLKWGANFRPSTMAGEWWRLFTCMFLHIGVIHLLMNMYALVYIGALLEPMLGRTRFLAAYVFTGIAASLLSLYMHPYTVSAGASGAIFGMYGVFLAMLTTNLIEKSARQALLQSIGVFVVYNLVFGMRGGVDNAAHIGGLLGGIVAGYLFYPTLRAGSEGKGRLVVITILLALAAGAVPLTISNVRNDVKIYEDGMAAISKKEEMALRVYNAPDTSSKERYLAQISDSGIHAWQESLDLLQSMRKLDLPDEVKKNNARMGRYLQLRKDTYELLYKRVQEDDTKYDSLISVYDTQVSAVLKEIEDAGK